MKKILFGIIVGVSIVGCAVTEKVEPVKDDVQENDVMKHQNNMNIKLKAVGQDHPNHIYQLIVGI